MNADLQALIESEGDEKSWEHAGLACRMLRHDSRKHWCGYVGLHAAHPSHGKGYDDIEADVHGGLTYAEANAPNCLPDGLWWVGFDCAHSGDLIPGIDRAGAIDSFVLAMGNLVADDPSGERDVYRTAEWVEAEVNKLADQLSA
jgi:hypothetical protein